MARARSSARLVPVNDDDADGPIDPEKLARGQAIAKRRMAAGFTSVRAFEDAIRQKGIKGLDRGTIGKAERGEASPGTYDRLEAFLADWDYETGSEREGMGDEKAEPTPDGPDTIELTVSIGALDWTATVKGPRDMPEVLTQQLAELMKAAMREAKGED